MASSNILPGTGQTLFGQVRNPQVESSQDGSFVPLSLGRQGQQHVSDVHGKYFAAASRGKLFLGSTVIAGVALPVNAANVVSKFTLWNPLGSGVNCELVEFGTGIDSATTVVNGVVAGFQFGVGSTITAPGTLTALSTSICIGPGAGATPAATLYSAATLVNASVLGPLMPIFGGYGAVTDAGIAPNPYQFDGKVVLPPGSLVTFLTTVAAATAAFYGLTWIEWPT